MPSRWGRIYIQPHRQSRHRRLRHHSRGIIISLHRYRRPYRLILANQLLASKLASVQGLLLVDKPVSWTSFDVVNYVRKLLSSYDSAIPKKLKVGHSGTLDPFASGLLLLLIGDYTKHAGLLTKLDKIYDLTLKL